MIDFHTHILPNIDDGARNIDETIELIKEAQRAGFDGIVLSSHYIEDYYETNVPERELLLKIINEKIKEKELNIKLYIANEIFITDNIMNLLEHEKASTLNNSSYVLFEMPLNIEPENLYNVIHELTINKLIPVLAHPERYTFIQKEPELMNDLIERGVLMQSNYGSVLGQYGNRAESIVRKFLENDMIHFLGTDVHREKTIYDVVPDALIEIKNIIGEEKLEELITTNPKLALNNKKININKPGTIEFTFKEKIMFYLKK